MKLRYMIDMILREGKGGQPVYGRSVSGSRTRTGTDIGFCWTAAIRRFWFEKKMPTGSSTAGENDATSCPTISSNTAVPLGLRRRLQHLRRRNASPASRRWAEISLICFRSQLIGVGLLISF